MASCRDCPAYLDEAQTKATFTRGRDIGTASCKRHGFVLGKPGLSDAGQQRVCESFATGCADFGKPVSHKARILASVISADMTVVAAPPATPDPLSTCRSCKNYVPDDVVKREYGWYLPLCAATGRLILPSQTSSLPKTCGYAAQGTNRDSCDGWATLDSRYEEGFSFTHVEGSSTAVEVDLTVAIVGPMDYETDKPVSDGDKKFGIRAWRKIMAPNGKNHTFLPCFDATSFPENERELIPKAGDDEHPELYVDHQGLVSIVAVDMQELEDTPVLIGDAGTGKTELFRHLAFLMGVPFIRVTITRSTEVDDLGGKFLFEEGETKWVDGRIAEWWQKRCVICLDEPNVGPDEVWQFIRPLTDNSKQLILDSAKGQHKQRGLFCYFGLAMNPSWDHKYVGANEISDADGNRLSATFVQLPPPHLERQILARACQEIDNYTLDEETLEQIMAIAENLRRQIEEGGLVVSWGIRPQIAVARKTKWYTLEDAYRRALVDRVEPETGRMILSVVNDFTTA